MLRKSMLEAKSPAGRFLVYHLYLKPRIIQNFRDRADGKLPDEWFDLDLLACIWGYYTGFPKNWRKRE